VTGRDEEDAPAEPEESGRLDGVRPERPRSDQDIAAQLRLRPERPSVTRLLRRVLAGLGGASAIVIAGALLFALRPHGAKAPGEELYNTDNRTTADGLNGLPRDYSGIPRSVPQLGPPLPGDLGRPMLNAGAQPPPISGPAPATAPDPEQQRLQHERQRLAQEMDAARVSRLFAGEARASVQPAVATGAPTTPTPLLDPSALGPNVGQSAAQQSEADRKLAFLTAPVDRKTIGSDRVQPPASRNVVQAGAVIPAALITGLRSDLPGAKSPPR